jgi:hypothetical protein
MHATGPAAAFVVPLAREFGERRVVGQLSRMRRSAPATLIFLAFTSSFGIAAHLLSELVGLGWHDDEDVLFSARHAYLALIAVVAFLALVAALLAVPPGDRRSRVHALIERLPLGGRGAGFTVLSFAAQFAFFAVTQIGEGCPLCGGDVFTGIIAAALAAAVGAALITFGKRRILDFALALVRYLAAAFLAGASTLSTSFAGELIVVSNRRTPYARRCRPPPVTIAI